MQVKSSDLALAHRLADVARATVRPFYRDMWSHETKADASPVTEVDRAVEAAMRSLLRTQAPHDGIIGEEYGAERSDASRQWVLDPIDGTTSFMAGRPIFGTLVALLQDGLPVLGIIDQPISGERWVGATGHATTYNGELTATRRCPELSGALLATTDPRHFGGARSKQFMTLAKCAAPGRMLFGGDCYNYGLLAGGHIDIVVEAGLKLHDFAALAPIVEGAGGKVRDWNGVPLSVDSGGDVIAVGDPTRLADVIGMLARDNHE